MSLQTLKSQVEHILKYNPETRNSDISLTILLWKTFYPQKIKDNQYVALADLFDLPREDNVKRIRAKFNSQNKYLPTSLEIALQRGILEEKWRLFMAKKYDK